MSARLGHAAAFGWFVPLCALLVLQGAACRRTAPSPQQASASAPAPSSARSASPGRDFELGEPSPSASVVTLGPAPASAAASERSDKLRQLLRGMSPAAQLPLAETDEGTPFASWQYRDLTTEVSSTPALKGLADIPGERLEVSLAPAVVVSGHLSADHVTRANVMRGGFRSCYRVARGSTPKLAGSVSLVLQLDREGNVTNVTFEAAPPGADALKHCIGVRARAQLFPPLAEGAEAKLRLKARFSATPF